MNPFVTMLASESCPPAPGVTPTKFDIDDNVGEGVHLHLRNARIDLSVAEFVTLADELTTALERMDDGHR